MRGGVSFGIPEMLLEENMAISKPSILRHLRGLE